MIPYIEEVKSFSLEHFGALPHLTIARDDKTMAIKYLTNLSFEDYDKVWSQFDSDFWRFKKSVFGCRRKEFCYAGDWVLQLDLSNGNAGECYKKRHPFNIFEDIDKPIAFKAIGRCLEPHCYNGHALLTLGCIPHVTNVRYGDIRNRIKTNGGEWLQPEVKSFFNSTLVESNEEYSEAKKRMILAEDCLHDAVIGNAKRIYHLIKK